MASNGHRHRSISVSRIEAAPEEAERTGGEGFEDCFVPPQRIDPGPFHERADELVTPVEALRAALANDSLMKTHIRRLPAEQRHVIEKHLFSVAEHNRLFDLAVEAEVDRRLECITACVADSFRTRVTRPQHLLTRLRAINNLVVT